MNEDKIALSNSSDSIPKVFYVFTNMNNWLTKHNIQTTKGISSASLGEITSNPALKAKYLDGTINYTQYVPNSEVDVHGVSMYSMNSTLDYRIEYNCELYRLQHNETRLLPSRMSCIYAFGNYKTCEKIANRYSWDLDSVKKYKLLQIPLTRVAKVNMEIVSLMRTAEGLGTWSQAEQEKIWKHYWSGGKGLSLEVQDTKLTAGIIWEYLIEGRLELLEV